MKSALTSFDGGVTLDAPIRTPDKYRLLEQIGHGPLIPRGAGLSYTAASFGSQSTSIDISCFNRLLSYKDGVLHVEAGASLGRIYTYLLSQGRYLPIQPGHPDITVGGCVAADVHGKNPFRDGTFSSLVKQLELFHPAHGLQSLSPTQQPELFDLTCGGYGLTGIITSVHLQTAPLPSSHVEITTIPVASINEMEALMRVHVNQYDLLYSWHDFTQKGQVFGRGFIKAAKFLPALSSPSPAFQPNRHPVRTLFAERRGPVPLSFFSLFRTKLFNTLFYRMNLLGSATQTLPLYDFLFPVHNKEVYFHLFGRRGFHECQFIIPSHAFAVWTAEVKEYLHHHPVPVSLASGKLFGSAQKLLRFSGTGVCMAMNFPRTDQSHVFANFLNDLAERLGAIPNINKDSLLSARTVAACYPEYETFRTRLNTYDPERLFRSHLSERMNV